MASELTITRSLLTEFIEAGIAAQGPVREELAFTPAQTEALREVARTAPQVAYGIYKVDGCGCPLAQAGLDIDDWYAAFWMTFDDRMSRALGYPRTRVVTVTDG